MMQITSFDSKLEIAVLVTGCDTLLFVMSGSGDLVKHIKYKYTIIEMSPSVCLLIMKVNCLLLEELTSLINNCKLTLLQYYGLKL